MPKLPTVMGPVGVGAAVGVVVATPVLFGVAVTVVEVTETGTRLYMLSLLFPPQYSVAFALQSILQPV